MTVHKPLVCAVDICHRLRGVANGANLKSCTYAEASDFEVREPHGYYAYSYPPFPFEPGSEAAIQTGVAAIRPSEIKHISDRCSSRPSSRIHVANALAYF